LKEGRQPLFFLKGRLAFAEALEQAGGWEKIDWGGWVGKINLSMISYMIICGTA
jgi:hypothetical protein